MTQKPADHQVRFADLPEETQEFLEDLRPEELSLLREAIRFMGAVKTVGTFVKWLIILICGSFIGAVAFGEALMKVKNYLLGK